VSIVLATAISSSAVKVSAVITPRSSSTLAKMIMISALVCSSQPTSVASPGAQPSSRPAMCTPASLPNTAATSSAAARPNTATPPTPHSVRRPVERKNTGISTSNTWWRSVSVASCPNHSPSSTAPARNAPTMKCRPAQSAPSETSASHTSATAQRSRIASLGSQWRMAQAASANSARNAAWRPMRSQSSRMAASTPQIAMSSRLA
jgi:hypothetical protein